VNLNMQDDRRKKVETAIMMRKFYRDVQQNKILSEAKKKLSIERKVSRTQRRASAIRKSNIKKIVRGY
jgi:ribosomal protein S21